MAEVKITDLVDQSAIDQIQKLDKEIKTLLDTYTNTAKELAKGINIEVKVAGDIDKLEALRSGKTQEAIDTQKKLTEAVQQQAQVVANTSNTISRQLQEQEKLNKSQREAYTSYQQVDNVLSKVHASYDEQAKKLIDLNLRLKENKAEMNATEKAFSSGAITMEQYRNKQAALIAQEGKLKQEKRQLTQLMTAEDKASLSAASSYSNMSQKLEMLKQAHK